MQCDLIVLHSFSKSSEEICQKAEEKIRRTKTYKSKKMFDFEKYIFLSIIFLEIMY